LRYLVVDLEASGGDFLELVGAAGKPVGRRYAGIGPENIDLQVVARLQEP